jgi:type IV pilus assembly protein PilW
MTDMPFIARCRGVTLVELMIAMVLGILVAGSILTIFQSVSTSNKAQSQLARMQEDGRFALRRLSDDLSMATGLYCNNTGGIANNTSSGVWLDGLRSPKVFTRNLEASLFDLTTRWGSSSGTHTYPAVPTSPYPLPSYFYMRGYSCTGASACSPALPTPFLDGPADTVGSAIGNRVKGSDVLTLRYLDASRGWRIGASSTVIADAGLVSSIVITPDATEPSATDFKSNTALLASCSNAQIFAVIKAGGTLSPDDANNLNSARPLALQPNSAPRLFDFVNDMRNVTYYLKMVSDDGTSTGVKSGALVRRVNGGTASVPDQELVRGVERLTFRYGVEDSNGNVRYLTADQVDSRAGSTITCPPTASALTTTDPGCLWRAIKTIEVSLLMASQSPIYDLSGPDLGFIFTPDGTTATLLPTEADIRKLAIRPSDQGFLNQKLRRQFTALVMLRNYNP